MTGMTSLPRFFAGWLAGIESHSRTARQRQAIHDETLCCFHQALHVAYGEFARRHPEWPRRGFDERFLRGEGAMLLASYWSQRGAAHRRPSGMDLARAWERKFGMLLCGADRVARVAELAIAANTLLALLACERNKG